MTQRAQILAQNRVLVPALTMGVAPKAPFFLKALNAVPPLRGLTARAVGIGLRPEHWHSDP